MDVETIADEALAVLGSGRQISPFSARLPAFGLEDAYRVTAAVRRRREQAGERPIGRKIGFTNRTIWAEFGVDAPIWGHVYEGTVHDLAAVGETLPLAGLAEPRIEPEIVFGLARAPMAGMDERAILGCIGWVAHGFEIVQSVYPGWKFAAADTVAAFGLHGALLLGPRHPIGGDAEVWRQVLSSFEIDLLRDDTVVDHGRAANVLDGPLFALKHFVELMARDTVNLPLAAGEIVTTGTLTKALPVVAGETWSTRLTGVALEGIRVRFQ